MADKETFSRQTPYSEVQAEKQQTAFAIEDDQHD